jgi:hypothetical protein
MDVRADVDRRTLPSVDAATPLPEPPIAREARPRRRPFGVLVVALIQLSSVGFAVIAGLTSWDVPWEGLVTTYLQEHAWARLVVLTMAIVVVVAAVGMWRLRYWGWALMVSLVGISLLLDLLTWWRSGSEANLATYVRLTLDVVCAFYLNTTAVQDAFRSPPEPASRPVAGTRSAGRVDP